MIDIQSTQDTREVPLQKVGVKNVRYPIQVLDKNHKVQSTTGTVNLFVNLPHNFKGTHMSRFIEVFHKHHNDISMNNFLEMLEEIRAKLDAERAFGRITFPYFIEKSAPVSKSAGLMEYTCSYEGEVKISSEQLAMGRGKAFPLGFKLRFHPHPLLLGAKPLKPRLIQNFSFQSKYRLRPFALVLRLFRITGRIISVVLLRSKCFTASFSGLKM